MLLLYIAIVGGAFLVWFVLVVLFTPALPYRLRQRVSVDDREFLHVLQSTCQASVQRGNRIQVLTDGEQFYPAMLEAISAAKKDRH